MQCTGWRQEQGAVLATSCAGRGCIQRSGFTSYLRRREGRGINKAKQLVVDNQTYTVGPQNIDKNVLTVHEHGLYKCYGLICEIDLRISLANGSYLVLE